MEYFKLLSSVAVFRSLYDAKKDLYDVLSEFIKAVISSKSLHVFTSSDCAKYIDEDFGLKIPEAILNSCLKHRLVKTGCINHLKGEYTLVDDVNVSNELESDFSESLTEYNEIVDRLYEHCSKKRIRNVDRSELEVDLEEYLTRPDKSRKYTQDISEFLISFENEEGFKRKINKIEEGLILYSGIRYSPDIATLGMWRGNLIVFLDSEHLFSATGLNGELYKTLFDDFHKLVKESNRNKKGGKVTIQYLDETNKVVERFFRRANEVVEHKIPINPSKTAMRNICNGCKSPSDVLVRKAQFFDKLNGLGIAKETHQDYYSKPEFNVESGKKLQEIMRELSEYNVTENQVSEILQVFTKVNFLRRGENKVGIDRVSCIFLTESFLPQVMAWSKHVHDGNGAIPFATNIEFLTEKFWFKLNKGFGDSVGKPASFDVIIRAKLTMASQMSKSVSLIYKELAEKSKSGDLNKSIAAEIRHEIFEAPSSPDQISKESMVNSKELLDDNYIEGVIRERSLLRQKAEKGEQAEDDLRLLKHKNKQSDRRIIKRVARRQHCLLLRALYILPLTIVLILVSFMMSPSDTILSLTFGVITFLGFFLPKMGHDKIERFSWSLSKQYYRNSITSLKTKKF